MISPFIRSFEIPTQKGQNDSMKSIRWDRVTRLVFGGLLLATLPTFVFADESDDVNAFVQSRTYVGILGTSVAFSGTGFGTISLLNTAQNEATLAPTFSQNFGWGVLLGRREGPYAAEVSFWQSIHQSSWNGTYSSPSGSVTFGSTLQGSSTFYSVNLDFKRYFLTDIDIQPFVSLGVNIPWIVVDDASENYNNNTFGNATFEGIGFDLGAGVEYYLDPTISVVGGLYQRWTGYGQYKGAENIDEQVQLYDGNANNFTSSGLDFYIGTTIGFI